MTKNINKQYNNFAEKYMQSQETYPLAKEESHHKLYSLIDFPVKNKKILDFGCGYGRDLSILYKKGARVYGIDNSKEMIKLAKIKYPYLENLFVQQKKSLPFSNNFFDFVISKNALHYNKNLDKVFKEIHKILKPKGLFIYLVPHPILSFILKKEKKYASKELVMMRLFHKQITVNEPSHTFSQYFSKFVLSNFSVLSIIESKDYYFKRDYDPIGYTIPFFMAVKLQKK